MTTAERNRAIKRVVSNAFPGHKVSVRGSRGTAYGWVSVDIDWTPLDAKRAGEMRGLVKQLLRAAKIDLGHSYTDDTCQYASDQCNVSFNPARFYETMRLSDGSMVGRPDMWAAEWVAANGP